MALTYGLIAAGVRYGAALSDHARGRPIMETLRTELPKYGGIFVQAEDELARHLLRPRLRLFRPPRRHRQLRPRTFAQDGGARLGRDGGDAAHRDQRPARRPEHGPAHQRRAERPACRRSTAATATRPASCSPRRNVEDCFHVALEAGRIAREYSTPVIILTDQALATRIEAFDEPDLAKLMVDPKPDLSQRGADFKPYPARPHHPPRPARRAHRHGQVPDRDRPRARRAGPSLRQPGPAREDDRQAPREDQGARRGAARARGLRRPGGRRARSSAGARPGARSARRSTRLRAGGIKVGQLHLRHLHPLPPGLEAIFGSYQQVLVVEMNDEGLYGFGQLAMLLRARYALPSIRSITKTDGLTFRVARDRRRREAGSLGRNGANGRPRLNPPGPPQPHVLPRRRPRPASPAPAGPAHKEGPDGRPPDLVPRLRRLRRPRLLLPGAREAPVPAARTSSPWRASAARRASRTSSTPTAATTSTAAPCPSPPASASAATTCTSSCSAATATASRSAATTSSTPARKNVRMTYVIMDNFVYGLTKKQTSPTSPIGFKSKTDPTGAIDQPINPMRTLDQQRRHVRRPQPRDAGQPHDRDDGARRAPRRVLGRRDPLRVRGVLPGRLRRGQSRARAAQFRVIEEKKHDGSPEDAPAARPRRRGRGLPPGHACPGPASSACSTSRTGRPRTAARRSSSPRPGNAPRARTTSTSCRRRSRGSVSLHPSHRESRSQRK